MIPPSPELKKRIKKTKNMLISGADLSSATDTISLSAFTLIQGRSSKRPQYYGKAPARISPRGMIKALVLLVDFEDNVHSRDINDYEEMLFSSNSYPSGSMRDYFKEVSNENLDVTGEVHGWYRMPQTYEYYVDGKFGTDGEYPHNIKKLVEDAVEAASQDINFADFDSDGDGMVDAIFIVHAGSGAEETGNKNDIWSHRWNVDTPITIDGVKVIDYTTEAEDGRIGLFCHEFVHVYNIPDLYDTDYDSAGLGDWCLMSGGSWAGTNPSGSHPIHPSAWVKKQLGWVTTSTPITNETDMSLKPVEDTHEVIYLWTNGNDSKEYFLLENRKKINFDSELPAEGLMIYHIDENQSTNSNQNHPLVGIEQADGKRHLERDINSGDGGDVYTGTSNNTSFDDSTTPNSRSYTDNDTLVSITNIQNSSDEITFDIEVTSPTASPSREIRTRRVTGE
jgi:immune inhibitor A